MPATLRFEGLDQLIDELAALPQGLTAGADQDALELATAAAASLRASLPRGETGRLRASVSVRRVSPTGGQVGAFVAVRAPYAHYVEYGTRYVRPRPVITPTVRRHKDAMIAAQIARLRAAGLKVTGGA
jgi:HK97 gp10 family phage protein